MYKYRMELSFISALVLIVLYGASYSKEKDRTWSSFARMMFFYIIYDLVALRVLVDTLPECYAVLGKVHQLFTPIRGRFKDYIATPKSNGYQSLHTTILFEGLPVEIQVRTFDMHRSAEYGYAAHWMYKEKRNKQDSLDEKLGWIRQILEENDNGKS